MGRLREFSGGSTTRIDRSGGGVDWRHALFGAMPGGKTSTTMRFFIGPWSAGFAGILMVVNGWGRVATSSPTFDGITPPATATSTGTWTFSGTAQPDTYVQVRIVDSPATAPLPGPLTNRPVLTDALGHWTQTVSQMTSPAGSYSFSAAMVAPTGQLVAASSVVAVSVSATTSSGNAVPVVSDATISGRVGIAIAPVQVQASGAPLMFTAPELAAYGLTITSSGLITGTPALAVDTTLDVTATNATGASFPARVVLSISQ